MPFRFGNLPKTVPQQNAQTQRQQAAAVQVASAKNRRLAQQMANRPTVLSALGVMYHLREKHQLCFCPSKLIMLIGSLVQVGLHSPTLTFPIRDVTNCCYYMMGRRVCCPF